MASFEDFVAPAQTTTVPNRNTSMGDDPFSRFTAKPETAATPKAKGALDEIGNIAKDTASNFASLMDMVASIPGMIAGTGADIASRAIGTATGQDRREAAKSGLAIGGKVTEAFSNPIQKLMTAMGYKEGYGESDVNKAMTTFASWIDKGGDWIEQHTGKALLKEDVQSLTNELMAVGGVAGLKLGAEAIAKPKQTPKSFAEAKQSYPTNLQMMEQAVKQGPEVTAKQVIEESLGIKNTKERAEWRKQRNKDVREAFKNDPDYADYLKYQAEERINNTATFGYGREPTVAGQTAAGGIPIAEPAALGPAQGFYPLPSKEVLNALRKPAFDRTADDILAIKGFKRDQGGRVNPEILARISAVGVGATVGAASSDNKIAGALAGALAGGIVPFGGLGRAKFGQAGAVKIPGGVWTEGARKSLEEPIRDTLLGGARVAAADRGEVLPNAKADILREWPTRAIKNHINKYLGTDRDPLKDIQIPYGEGTRSWGELTDQAIRSAEIPDRLRMIKEGKAQIGEDVWGLRDSQLDGTRHIQSYLSHVGDYLREFVPADKLQNYDLVRAVRETDAQDVKQAKKMEKARISGEGTTLYKDYGDGFKWVEVGKGSTKELNEAALKNEGDIMGHCVGGYCEAVHRGKSKIYSLRDKKGMSHVTVEVGPGMSLRDASLYAKGTDLSRLQQDDILQIKGKQNRAPTSEYLPYVQDFVKSGKWWDVGDLENSGLVNKLDNYNEPFRRAADRLFPDQKYLSKEDLDKIGKAVDPEEVKAYTEGRLRDRERGSVDPALLARMAVVGISATGGIALDPEHPVHGAIIGALAGVGLTKISPSGIGNAFRKAIGPDTRIRINDLANAYDTEVARSARVVWQAQNPILENVKSEASRNKITHWIQGNKSIKLTPTEQKAAMQAQTFFAQMAEQGTKSKVLKDTIDNYVTNLWDLTGKNKSVWESIMARHGGASMSPDSRFALKRSISNLAEGKALGLTPLTEDVAQIMGIYGNSLTRSIANRRFIESLKAEVDPSTKVPLVQLGTRAPTGYVPIDHPQLMGTRVHPDIASSLKFIFDNKDPGVISRGLQGLNMVTKRMAVSFSLFHAKALADAFIGAANNPLAVGKLLAQAAAPKIFGQNRFLTMLREGGQGDLADIATSAGVKFSFERAAPAVEDVSGSFYTAMSDLQKALDSTVPGMGLLVKGFITLNHKVDNFMWGRLHAAMKLTIFAEKYASLMENNAKAHAKNPTKFPMPSEAKIAEVAASFTNDIFGGLNWRRVAEESTTKWGRDIALNAYSPTGRSAMQLLLFAPDWTISTTRAALKAFGKGTGPGGIVSAKNVADLHRQYLIRSALYYAAVGDAINYSLSGHHLWENKDPTTIDMGDGRTMQWSKHTMEPVHWITKPGQQALNKLGFVPRESLNQMLGTEYLSTTGHAPRMDTSPGGRVKHAASKGFIPIAGQQGIDQDTAGASIAGFMGAPIYGKTQRQKDREKLERRIKKLTGK